MRITATSSAINYLLHVYPSVLAMMSDMTETTTKGQRAPLDDGQGDDAQESTQRTIGLRKTEEKLHHSHNLVPLFAVEGYHAGGNVAGAVGHVRPRRLSRSSRGKLALPCTTQVGIGITHPSTVH